MPHNQFTLFVLIGLVGAIYSLTALVGSDGNQTRWSLIFVISTIVFYSATITRKRHIEEEHLEPGGRSPVWVLWGSVGATIVALVAMFYVSVGSNQLRSRELGPPNTVPAVSVEAPPA